LFLFIKEKEKSPRKAIESCEAKSFYGKINLFIPTKPFAEKQDGGDLYFFRNRKARGRRYEHTKKENNPHAWQIVVKV